MQELLHIRLDGLKSEFQLGQHKLLELENQANTLRNNLLRISGAIQVLEEELLKAQQSSKEKFNNSMNQELHAGVGIK